MAVDDVITDIVSVAQSTSSYFQPAAGVEVVIIGAGADLANATGIEGVGQYDGSLSSAMFKVNYDIANMNGSKIGITNGHYLRLWNGYGSGAVVHSYTGIQTK